MRADALLCYSGLFSIVIDHISDIGGLKLIAFGGGEDVFHQADILFLAAAPAAQHL